MTEGAAPTGSGGDSPAALRPAATVMVVRDGPHPSEPLEVLMLRRNLRLVFAGGAYVFPGGAVDPGDAGRRAADRCHGLDDDTASGRLGVDRGGLAYWVAAIRECFEEAGVLLACDADGTPVPMTELGRATRVARHRHDVNRHRRSFLDICEEEGLWLAAGRLGYVAHWITPVGAPRRYDTRFFVAPAPPDQTPAHDSGETIADVWVRPNEALARHRVGGIDMMLPTVRMLEWLARHPTVAGALADAAAPRAIPAVLPRLRATAGDGWRLLVPGDVGYDGEGAPPVAPPGATTGRPPFSEAAAVASRAANAAPSAARGDAAAPEEAP